MTDVFQLKMYWAENRVMFCSFEIQFFSVVVYVFKAVPEFDCRLVLNKTLRHIVLENHFLAGPLRWRYT